ncbi:MAG TPA: UDP-N-acetylglucosamine 2-epimerase (non-hydrolyzing), partial [Balneola sp.]|nr:UDP-N-acetylglucosamine 2-epimerase (non-hydrolyzing) [Balneola sp.]
MLIDLIAGARPNFMKIAPIIESIKKFKKSGIDINYRLVHTGQHYDKNMSESFFKELNIPDPDLNLNAGGGTQSEQTAAIMIGYEKALANKPDLCLVVGDVNSTMACSIVARKNGVKVAHVEGGIRSGDMNMPEEVNRIVTDSITNYFFTTSEIANNNLLKSGIDKKNIFFVGNTMIDTLLKNRHRFKAPLIWYLDKLQKREYIVMTLHRPSNVDQEIQLKRIIFEIINSTDNLKIVFPVHPRTKKNLIDLNIVDDRLIYTDPLSYLEFNYLVENSYLVITDSGGITEETTVMGVPCITLRDSTERPETVTIGTNELLGTDPKRIKPAIEKLKKGEWKEGRIPHLWDGQ